MPRGKRRRHRGGILRFLIPAAVLAAEAAKRKKKPMGKISRGKWAADKQLIWRTLRRTGLGPLAKLAVFK